MSEIYKCMVARDSAECSALFERCMAGDADCIKQYNELKRDFEKGLKKPTPAERESIRKMLEDSKVVLDKTKTADQILEKWIASMPDTPERAKIASNTTMKNILLLFIEFVIREDFSGDPATIKTSKMWFSRRPMCTDPKVLFSGASLTDRPTSRTRTGLGVMVGGGSQNERKNISYVNKIRYLDSLNSYYSMVGGASEPTNCAADLQRMYENITSNLQNHGKQVEDSDNRIIETMLNKFSELESKVAQIQENLKNLASVNGSNVSGVISSEKSKLSTESKYLSNQGKSITSIIRSLLESTDNIGDNNIRSLTNARLQFPQHTTTY